MTAADVKASPESGVGDFARLIGISTRWLFNLARLPLFGDAKLTLAEWLALSVLAERDGVNNKLLARSAGFTRQRANQLCSSLAQAGLISVRPSTQDGRQKVITITDVGRARLAAVNAQLQAVVGLALNKRERSLVTAGRTMRPMMRMVQTEAPRQKS